MTIVIRVDGGSDIGLGHAMRCSTLAAALNDMSLDVEVLTLGLPEVSLADLRRSGTRIVEMSSTNDAVDYLHRRQSLSAVVADGYHLVDEIRTYGRLECQIAMIDDNRELPIEIANLVLNQNPHATPALYADVSEHCVVLAGVQYVLLRPSVASIERDLERVDRLVLVSFGGSDPTRLTLPVVEHLLALDGVQVIVAAAPRHPDREGLSAIADADERVTIDRGDLIEALCQADYAVIGGGTTMYEVAHLGIPSVAAVIADNQREGVAAAARLGIVATAEGDAESIVSTIDSVMSDESFSSALSERGRQLIDGDGASRVARALAELLGRPLRSPS